MCDSHKVVLHFNHVFPMPSQLYEFTLREDYYREDPGAESPRPVFGQVTGTDRDIGSNAILFYHALGDGKSVKGVHNMPGYSHRFTSLKYR